jgi:hypothetical protein
MSSHSRNSRAATRVLQLACAAALLAGSSVYAAEQPHSFELTAISNSAGGEALVKGQYDIAADQLANHRPTLDAGEISTNRCVVLTVTRQLEAARVECNAAVHDALSKIASTPSFVNSTSSGLSNYLALAYSNRAVVNWLLNDATAAQADLKRAAAAAPKAEFVARNQTALESREGAVQVAAVSSKG